MKTSNTDIFECLCLELELPLLESSKIPTLADLGELRKQFLDVLENQYDTKLFSEFIKGFSQWFSIDRLSRDFLLGNHGLVVNDVAIVSDIYQVLSFWLKVPKRHTKQHEQAYVNSFLKNEEETRAWRIDRSNPVSRLARQLVRRLGTDLDLSRESLHGLGRHGPGAVFGREVGTDKNFFSDPPHDLALSYGPEMFFANASFHSDYANTSTYNRSERHVISRLVLVPKDYRGPRGVFISPKEVMFCQLAQDAAFKDLAKKTWLRNCYNPYDQEPSRALAFMGSCGRGYDTFDLKDASDRVPLSLISYLFSRADYLALARTRPSYVELPNGSLHRMAMFSPMGDGKTFSVLSTVVACIVLAALLEHDGWLAARLVPMDVIERYSMKFRVFGDDVAVEHGYRECVCAALEIHNLKINKQKTFSEGFFRESCGMDAYRGFDITPLRLKVDFDGSFDYHKAVEFHNRIVTKYSRFTKLACLIRSFIETSYRYVGYTTDSRRDPMCLQLSDSISVKNAIWNRSDRLSNVYNNRSYSSHNTNSGRTTRKRLNIKTLYTGLRFNDELQYVEHRTYAPASESNLISSLDPWWDLNYWLLTSNNKNERDFPAPSFSDIHKDIRGSRIASQQYREILEQVTNRRICKGSDRLGTIWVRIP